MYKVDVVIPTTGEPYLAYCINAVKKNVLVNNIILVSPENSYVLSLRQSSDVKIVVSNEKNIGKIRALGLKYVTTSYYASIDSDVLVTKEWFEWCMATIKKKDVGVCHGYLKDLGKHSSRLRWDQVKRGSYVDLGNAMLKTSVIHMVGMPEKRYGEDRKLRFRIENAGYKWVFNENIVCQHLRTDIDAWRHDAKWAEIAGIDPYICFQSIAWAFTKGLLKPNLDVGDCLFAACNELFRLYGYWKGVMRAHRN